MRYIASLLGVGLTVIGVLALSLGALAQNGSGPQLGGMAVGAVFLVVLARSAGRPRGWPSGLAVMLSIVLFNRPRRPVRAADARASGKGVIGARGGTS